MIHLTDKFIIKLFRFIKERYNLSSVCGTKIFIICEQKSLYFIKVYFHDSLQLCLLILMASSVCKVTIGDKTELCLRPWFIKTYFAVSLPSNLKVILVPPNTLRTTLIRWKGKQFLLHSCHRLH
jgi:hypothetical protein